MSESLSFELVCHEDTVVAVLAGTLDRADAEVIRRRVLNAMIPPARGLVCDLSGLAYIDSAGVHLLHRLCRALEAAGQRFVAVHPRAQTPRRVLEITGIATAIPMYGSLDEAIAATAMGVIGLAE